MNHLQMPSQAGWDSIRHYAADGEWGMFIEATSGRRRWRSWGIFATGGVVFGGGPTGTAPKKEDVGSRLKVRPILSRRSAEDIDQCADEYHGHRESRGLKTRLRTWTPTAPSWVRRRRGEECHHCYRVLTHPDKIDLLIRHQRGGCAGDAYEYLIGQFARGPGKRRVSFIRRNR